MIERGGTNEARLYLHDSIFITKEGVEINVKKTDMPNMAELITRHKARYYLPAFFCRHNSRVLDFPCGSGYGYSILGQGTIYKGIDNDFGTIEYAKKSYSNVEGTFVMGNLQKPQLKPLEYDVIACIEGLEHISKVYQSPIIEAFKTALNPTGVFVVTCPSAPEKSGPSEVNKYHKWELTEDDFTELLTEYFEDVTILKTNDILHNGEQAMCLYGICRKEGETK